MIEGQLIPKGTHVVIAPWATNFDPTLWGPDVDEFKPERWLDADSASYDGYRFNPRGGASTNFAFLTFAAGPRGCIGKDFARAELAYLVPAWVGQFEMKLADPAQMDEDKIKICRGITVRPDAVCVKLQSVLN